MHTSEAAKNSGKYGFSINGKWQFAVALLAITLDLVRLVLCYEILGSQLPFFFLLGMETSGYGAWTSHYGDV